MTEPPTTVAGLAWQNALDADLERLGRWMRGRLLSAPALSDRLVPAVKFFDPDRLRPLVADMCGLSTDDVDAGGGTDQGLSMRIAASRFARRYGSSLTTIGLVALARGVGLDLSPQRCAVHIGNDGLFRFQVRLDDDEVVRCAQRPTDWPVRGRFVETVEELREYVWSRLYGRHLAPLFRLVLQFVQVSERLLWTSAGEYVGNVSDSAEEYLSPEQALPFVADRKALLAAPRLPGVPKANPLTGTVEWLPVDSETYPRAVQNRRLCCLTYLLEDRQGMLCQNCPYLPVEEKVAMVKERHGRPIGTPNGPAAARAREIGLRRPSIRRRASTPPDGAATIVPAQEQEATDGR